MDEPTFLQGIQTNFGKANLMLVQNKSHLIKMRAILQQTEYYSHWDPEMLGASEYENLLECEDKTVKIYEGLYHEVYNELEKDRKVVLKDLGDWLDSHL